MSFSNLAQLEVSPHNQEVNPVEKLLTPGHEIKSVLSIDKRSAHSMQSEDNYEPVDEVSNSQPDVRHAPEADSAL